MRKPTIKTGPASPYAMDAELIREFSDGRSGGLISVWRNPNTDRLTVRLYRLDADVDVVTNYSS